jgi:hypothetical protein
MVIFKKANLANPDSLIYIVVSKLFTLRASRSHRSCIVAARTQKISTASRAAALHIRRPPLVNNPDRAIREVRL